MADESLASTRECCRSVENVDDAILIAVLAALLTCWSNSAPTRAVRAANRLRRLSSPSSARSDDPPVADERRCRKRVRWAES